MRESIVDGKNQTADLLQRQVPALSEVKSGKRNAQEIRCEGEVQEKKPLRHPFRSRLNGLPYSSLASKKTYEALKGLKGNEGFQALDQSLGNLRDQVLFDLFEDDAVQTAYALFRKEAKELGDEKIRSINKVCFLKKECDKWLGRKDGYYSKLGSQYERELSKYYAYLRAVQKK